MINRFVLSLLIVFAFRTAVYAAAIVYPVPGGIALNPDFAVKINDGSGWVNVPVQDIVDSCFVHFEMNGSVDVEIKASTEIQSYRLSPESARIKSQATGSKLSFTLSKPKKLILLVNKGAGNHTTGLDGLILFAEAPETDVPSLSDTNVVNIMSYGVDDTGKTMERARIQRAFDENANRGKIIYFPPGIYQSGQLHMRSKQSLYLAPGATIRGSADFADYSQIPGEGNMNENYLLGSWCASDIKVYGRGIINGNGTALRLQDPTGANFKTHNIQFMGTTNIVMKDIISLDAGSWSIEPIFCDHLTMANIKILSDLRYYGNAKLNTDGFDINKCRHVLVEDSFAWCCDDAMTPKQDSSTSFFPCRDLYDITFRNMLVYTRKCAFKLGDETKNSNFQLYDLTVENVDIVFADRAIAIWSDEGMLIRDLLFKDIRIEKISTEYKQNHINCRIDPPGNSIRNVSFVNLTANEPAPKGSVFEGKNLGKVINGETVQYYNIRFENYTISGELVMGLDNKKAGFVLNNSPVSADPAAFSFAGPAVIPQ